MADDASLLKELRALAGNSDPRPWTALLALACIERIEGPARAMPTPGKVTLKIIDPWLNGDPCEGCRDCERVCRKLQDRITAEVDRLGSAQVSSHSMPDPRDERITALEIDLKAERAAFLREEQRRIEAENTLRKVKEKAVECIQFDQENLDAITDDANSFLSNQVTPRYLWRTRLELSKSWLDFIDRAMAEVSSQTIPSPSVKPSDGGA